MRLDGRWRVRSLVAECVGAILLVSVALAYASPPDPSWIPGIYDDRDNDDAVAMVTDGTGVSDSHSQDRPDIAPVGLVSHAVTERTPVCIAHQRAIRGPPIEASDTSADPLLTYAHKVLLQSRTPPVVRALSREIGFAGPGDRGLNGSHSADKVSRRP